MAQVQHATGFARKDSMTCLRASEHIKTPVSSSVVYPNHLEDQKPTTIQTSPELDTPLDTDDDDSRPTLPIPSYYGPFGGRFVAEPMFELLDTLAQTFTSAIRDPAFWALFSTYRSQLQSHLPKPSIHTLPTPSGSKIHLATHTTMASLCSILGQALLAQRLGLQKIITDTRSPHSALLSARVCSLLNIHCTIFIGAADLARHPSLPSLLAPFSTTTSLVPVLHPDDSPGTLRDAVGEAQRHLIGSYIDTFYLANSSVAPYPLPFIVRTFTSIVGEEVRHLISSPPLCTPASWVACVVAPLDRSVIPLAAVAPFVSLNPSSPSSLESSLLPQPSSEFPSPRLILTEPLLSQNPRSLGVYQGAKTLVHQTRTGQILPTESAACSAGEMARWVSQAVGPEVAAWVQEGRVEIVGVEEGRREVGALVGALVGAGNREAEAEGLTLSGEAEYAVEKGCEVARGLGVGRDVLVWVDVEMEMEMDGEGDGDEGGR